MSFLRSLLPAPRRPRLAVRPDRGLLDRDALLEGMTLGDYAAAHARPRPMDADNELGRVGLTLLGVWIVWAVASFVLLAVSHETTSTLEMVNIFAVLGSLLGPIIYSDRQALKMVNSPHREHIAPGFDVVPRGRDGELGIEILDVAGRTKQRIVLPQDAYRSAEVAAEVRVLVDDLNEGLKAAWAARAEDERVRRVEARTRQEIVQKALKS